MGQEWKLSKTFDTHGVSNGFSYVKPAAHLVAAR